MYSNSYITFKLYGDDDPLYTLNTNKDEFLGEYKIELNKFIKNKVNNCKAHFWIQATSHSDVHNKFKTYKSELDISIKITYGINKYVYGFKNKCLFGSNELKLKYNNISMVACTEVSCNDFNIKEITDLPIKIQECSKSL